MNGCMFNPTPEQQKVIYHESSAFITACPGAGKTRVMVERARHMLRTNHNGRGVAFLSFTRAAVSELEERLRQEALLCSPVFPHFIGTFDSFIWQFVVAPFGITGIEAVPRLIPDKGCRIVQPFEKAQPLPLSCFDRVTGKIDAVATLRLRFDVNKKNRLS
ncbi:MAG: UvrD-helicase domain-containing protein [Nitrospirae bacterium]|nr:UvrD-helicase domain-containing protein [Nitrospirota bacterium]